MKFLQNFFQTPSAVGMAFSDSAVAICEIEQKKRSQKIKTLTSITLPKGCIDNGVIQNEELLIKTLAPALKKYSGRSLYVTLPFEQTFDTFIKMEGTLTDKELLSRVEDELEQVAPLPRDEIAHQVRMSRHKGFTLAGLTILPKKILNAYSALAPKLNISFNGLEPTSKSVLRTIQRPEGKHQGYMFVLEDTKNLCWYTVWEGLVFDSNNFTDPSVEKVIDDITHSMNHFADTHKDLQMEITEIVFVGSQTGEKKYKKATTNLKKNWHTSTPRLTKKKATLLENVAIGSTLQAFKNIQKK